MPLKKQKYAEYIEKKRLQGRKSRDIIHRKNTPVPILRNVCPFLRGFS